MAGFAVSDIYGLSVALLFIMGAGGAIANNLLVTQFQTHAEDRMRGRVMSILRITDSFEPLGFVVGGALATLFGNQEALLISAVAGASMLALTFARSTSIRRS